MSFFTRKSIISYSMGVCEAQKIKGDDESLLENNWQRITILTGVIALSLLFIMSLWFYHVLNEKNKRILQIHDQLTQLRCSKSSLSAVVVHDLRSPLNTLKRMSQDLIVAVEQRELSIIKQLAISNRSMVENAAQLLDNLLNWMLEQSGQLLFKQERLNLHTALEMVAFNYKTLANYKGLKLKINVCKSIYVFADLNSLKIIFRNLLDNAFKYTEKGEVSIFVAGQPRKYCEIVVKDTGIGMNTQVLDQLTNGRGVTTADNDGNTGGGLGLRLCKALIEKNKGKWAIKSEIGKGTVLKIYIPI